MCQPRSACSNDIASQVFPLGFSAFSSPRLSPTDDSLDRNFDRLASTRGGDSPVLSPSLFRFLRPSLSPTLRVPEAASKELSYPRAAHTDFPPSSPFPSTTVTPSPSIPLPLPLRLRAHAVTRSHAANTCSCLPLQSYGTGDDADVFNNVVVV